MSGFARLVANVLVMGGGVVGKAFIDAYKQALQNGGKVSRASLRGGGISPQEARSILNVKPESTPAEIEAAYARMHAMNDPAKGGSAYLQSKISNARAALSEEPAEGGAAGGGTAAKGQKNSSGSK